MRCLRRAPGGEYDRQCGSPRGAPGPDCELRDIRAHFLRMVAPHCRLRMARPLFGPNDRLLEREGWGSPAGNRSLCDRPRLAHTDADDGLGLPGLWSVSLAREPVAGGAVSDAGAAAG